jgi:NAD(P)-dependent dehydrogenase (short-subunit alcohol dehydrogenase family)
LVETQGSRIIASAADIRDLDALQAAVDEGVETYRRLDIIVANAGICIPSPWNEITPESFRDITDVYVTETWNTVVSSYAGVKVQPYMVHYTASKHAVTGWPGPSPRNWADITSGSTACILGK